MIATCSHVGHVFRKSTPYTFPGGTSKIVNHNNARLAEVWLDDWKEFYFSINPGEATCMAFPASRGQTTLTKDIICFYHFDNSSRSFVFSHTSVLRHVEIRMHGPDNVVLAF